MSFRLAKEEFDHIPEDHCYESYRKQCNQEADEGFQDCEAHVPEGEQEDKCGEYADDVKDGSPGDVYEKIGEGEAVVFAVDAALLVFQAPHFFFVGFVVEAGSGLVGRGYGRNFNFRCG